jgi:hypothetical protein
MIRSLAWARVKISRGQGLTKTQRQSRASEYSTMKFHNKYRLWAGGVITLALFSFLAGTSLACLQVGVGSTKMAEDCCKGHCQHVMAADMAAQCCQSHQVKVSQPLPVPPQTKDVSWTAYTLHVSLIPPVVRQGPEQSWVRLSTAEPPPPFPPLYALHCTLLI